MALERSLSSRIAALAAAVEDAPGSDAELLASLATVGELRRAVDALGAELAHEVVRRSAGEESLARKHGEKSPELLVARTTGIDPVEAGTWCLVGAAGAPRVSLQGEVLPATFPALAAAIGAGTMMAASARLVAETLDTISGTIDTDELATIERILVDITPTLSLRDVRRLCAQAIDRADPDGTAPREEELRRLTGVKTRTRRDGLIEWIITMLPEHAGFLTAGVDARTAPRRQPTFTEDQAELDMMADDRTLAQARLDALVSIARDSLRYDDGDVAGTAVTMVVTMTLEALQTGIGQAFIEGVDTPISAAAARRLACDAEIIPAVLGGHSEPLDLGHASRNHMFAREPAGRDDRRR